MCVFIFRLYTYKRFAPTQTWYECAFIACLSRWHNSTFIYTYVHVIIYYMCIYNVCLYIQVIYKAFKLKFPS